MENTPENIKIANQIINLHKKYLLGMKKSGLISSDDFIGLNNKNREKKYKSKVVDERLPIEQSVVHDDASSMSGQHASASGGRVLKKIGYGKNIGIYKKKLGGSSTLSLGKEQSPSIIEKVLKTVSGRVLKPMLSPIVNQLLKIKGKKTKTGMNGGKKLKDFTPQELEELNQQKLENQIWKKSKVGKRKVAELNELTNAEKMANIKKVGREYKKQMQDVADARYLKEQEKDERDANKAERETVQAEREAKRLASEKGNDIWDNILDAGIGAVASVVPGGKIIQGITKGALSYGKDKLRGRGRPRKLGCGKFGVAVDNMYAQNIGGAKKHKTKRIISPKQKAYFDKLKSIMVAEGCSYKQAMMKNKMTN